MGKRGDRAVDRLPDSYHWNNIEIPTLKTLIWAPKLCVCSSWKWLSAVPLNPSAARFFGLFRSLVCQSKHFHRFGTILRRNGKVIQPFVRHGLKIFPTKPISLHSQRPHWKYNRIFYHSMIAKIISEAAKKTGPQSEPPFDLYTRKRAPIQTQISVSENGAKILVSPRASALLTLFFMPRIA